MFGHDVNRDDLEFFLDSFLEDLGESPLVTKTICLLFLGRMPRVRTLSNK